MMTSMFLILSLNILTIMLKKYFFNMIIMNLMFLINNFYLMLNFHNMIWIKLNYIFGVDYISLNLIILTIWIMSLSFMASNQILIYKFNLMFSNLMIMLTIILILSFSSLNIMLFFIFFEMSLIPIIMIIMGWGKQIDRIQASMYMLFYTLCGSLPLLIMIMFIYKNENNLSWNMLSMNNFNLNNNEYLFTMMTSAFFIKMPMYWVHLWLPKAHVEAPISGSMILAGIMLKLGSYGLYRSMMIYPSMFFMNNSNYMIFTLIGSLMSSMICLNQNDLKIIVAYSSVVHMGILMSGMMTMYNYSLMGSLMLMIAHGLCSSGMFFLVNVNYERLKSRNIFINKGMINIFPSLSVWFFLIFSSNFSAPPSLNLFSEIMLFNSLIQWNNLMISLIFFISLFSTTYSIFMYAYTQYGDTNMSFFNLKSINCREFLICFLIWMPLNLMFLFIKIIY